MIPTYIIPVEQIPLTTNGKIDRKALLENHPLTRTANYVAPANEIEEALVRMWTEVLKEEPIGVYDNFFELGGHSLKATLIVGKIAQHLKVKISLKQFFTTPTIKGLAEYIQRMEKGEYDTITPAEPMEYYPVSSVQKRLYSINQFTNITTTYNTPAIFWLEGEVDLGHLNQVINQLVQRHEILRTSFHYHDGDIYQKVHEHVLIQLEVQQAEEAQVGQCVEEFIRPFDLSQAPLFRAGLIQCENKSIFMVDMHHIVSDGFSVGILIEDFANLYEGRALPELTIHYKDFAVWQKKFFQSGALQEQETYWLENLRDPLPVLQLPCDYQRSPQMVFDGDIVKFTIPQTLQQQINQLAKNQQVTLFIVFIAALKVTLAKYSGQDDLIVGTAVSGRSKAELEKIIGMFVNTLPIRSYPTDEKTFAQYLQEINERVLSAFENQDYPFDMMIKNLDLERDTSRNPLFDVVFTLQNNEMAPIELTHLKVTPYQADSHVAKFDLNVIASEYADGIHVAIEYRTNLFKPETIRRLGQHWSRVLEAVCQDVNVTLAAVELVSAAEKEQILQDFNQTQVEYPKDATIGELFTRQAEQRSSEIAVTFEDQILTYGELNAKANQLARVLRSKGVSRDQAVGVLLHNRIELIVGIVAIIKAGGAYLPIDPTYPKSRIEFMLRDAHASLLLTEEEFDGQFAFAGESLYLTDDRLYQGDASNLELINRPEDLIYIMYTSGSTGQPKGVMIEHRNVNRLISHSNMLKISQEDRILQTGSLAFDASTFEIWGALLNGAKLYLVKKGDVLSPVRFEEIMKAYQITQIWQTAPLFNQLVEERPSIYENLQVLYVGGDKLSPKHISLVKQLYPHIKVVNGYGPTESTTFTTFYEITEVPDGKKGENIPIGKPVSNTQVYIVNRDNQVQPIGVFGELCIGGDGLGRGYVNQPILTAEKFVENPFQAGTRIYKSGDLARWLPDGNIDFVGRMDHQVKIRGFRIEPDEIEYHLLKHPKVKEAVVMVRNDPMGKKYLVAYLTVNVPLEGSELRTALLQELPEYMIPTYFVTLPEIPLTSNGKVDRQALPEPTMEANSVEYAVPQSEAEEKLARIWSEVLLRESVGVHDNFFEIGGDSINAIQILVRAYQAGINISANDIFLYKTIRAILENVDYQKKKKEISQEEVHGEVLLTPIQRWFFEQKLSQQQYFHQSVFFGFAPDVDVELLEQAFRRLIAHHDALRMSYRFQNQTVSQFIRPIADVEFRLDRVDLSGLAEDLQKEQIVEVNERMQSQLNLEQDLLIQGIVFDLGPQGKRILITIHHLVIDGVSWRILLEDLQSLYHSNCTATLPLKTTSYQEWSKTLLQYAQSDYLDTRYWEKIMPESIASLTHAAVKEMSYGEQAHLSFTLDAETTGDLLTKVNWAYNTEINDILLSALALALKEVLDVKQTLVTLEGHGREVLPGMEAKGVDISRTIGWFTSIYPVYLEAQDEIESTIKNVKENLRKIPNKGVDFSIQRYLNGHPQLAQLNPDISFNYLGQFDNILQTDGGTTLFRPALEESGQKIHQANSVHTLLDITSSIINGKLQVNFTYVPKYLSDQQVTQLQSVYLQKLTEIIAHCVGKNEQTYTASDFQLEKVLEEEDMDYLSNLFDL